MTRHGDAATHPTGRGDRRFEDEKQRTVDRNGDGDEEVMRKLFASEPEIDAPPSPEVADTSWWDALCEETKARQLEETPLPPASAPPGSVDGW